MKLLSLVPETSASANSATSANINLYFSVSERVTACGTQNRLFGLERRAVLTAAPSSPRFISHRECFGDDAANSATSAKSLLLIFIRQERAETEHIA